MMIKTPIIIINFKAYSESTGSKAVVLAKKIERAAKKHKVSVAVAVQAPDIYRVAKEVSIPVFSQHVDFEDYGAHTGKILLESIKESGAKGTLINHSEFSVSSSHVGEVVRKCKKLGIVAVVCVKDSNQAAKLALYNPDFIAVEPPELIGGSVSVATSNPDIIKSTVNKVYKTARTNVLAGAGIHEARDVEVTLSLGGKGVLVASGVVCAKSPFRAVEELIKGLKK